MSHFSIHSKINFNVLTGIRRIPQRAFVAAAEKTTKIASDVAQEDYKKKRMTKKQPSYIISSFTEKIKSSSNNRVIGVIQAGGPTAPYAVFVNYGHHTPSGNWWEGYHFMEAGARAAEEIAPQVLKIELDKRLRTIAR